MAGDSFPMVAEFRLDTDDVRGKLFLSENNITWITLEEYFSNIKQSLRKNFEVIE